MTRKAIGIRLAIGVAVGLAWGTLGDGSEKVWSDTPRVVSVAALVGLVAIRAWYALRMAGVAVKKRYRERDLPRILLQLGLLVPVVWVVSPYLDFANYPSSEVALVVGTLCYLGGLWICQRAHADLGTGLSPTLEIKERHALATAGIYRRIRHPMYSGFLIFVLGQALVVPNAVAGPAGLVGTLVLVALRLEREEQMLLEEFGADYARYRARTSRLVPGVW